MLALLGSETSCTEEFHITNMKRNYFQKGCIILLFLWKTTDLKTSKKNETFQTVFCCQEKSCLELPESTDVVAAFKAGWHHALIQTSLYAGQTRGACPDHCYSVHHDGAARQKEKK